MKSYVITIMDMPESVNAAKKCIQSMPEYDVQMFSAITPKDDPEKLASKYGLNLDFFRFDGEKYSRHHRCISAFMSHYTLWQKCIEDNEEYQIFEHDAVCVGNLPKYINYQGCISLGAPSYGKWKTPQTFGVNPLTSKQYFPGAHAYRMKPSAAKVITAAAEFGSAPTDVYLNLASFPWLEEYYPWPVIARDSFTTIQTVNGCIAKHNYKEGRYDII